MMPFGRTRCIDLVEDLANVIQASDGNRATRKAIGQEHSAKTHPRVKTVTLADLPHDRQAIGAHRPGFARVHVRENESLLTMLREGNPLFDS